MNSNTILEVRNLSKSYGGVKAVNNVSFSVKKGEIVGLIGPNGAGKTTSFNAIAGAEKPTSGEVFLNSENVTGRSTEQLYHRGLLRTFQLSQEYPKMTTLENLMVACKNQIGENILMNWLNSKSVILRENEVIKKATETLDFLGLSHVSDELAGNLSGGQKKLLELGRTMMADAKLILLDEPGAGVNPTLMQKIGDMIIELNQKRGYTFCLIEHDMQLIERLCHRIIVLAEGRILQEGSMEEIRNNAKVVDAYFGSANI
jgi:branched-chain amino acid transport system ATP-binding protein|tara:strand:- start:589 stop:1365 length:777 start_codon:yes stop_codon:yes gene_type:complete